MSRVFNFSAGPAALPLPVLERAAAEMVEYGTAGMSVMEMSHRGKASQEIFVRTKQAVIDLLGVPGDYEVLFLQGGATAQFAMVPMNLLGEGGKADYVNTGVWSRKAIAEARKFGTVNVAASSESTGFNRIPDQAELPWYFLASKSAQNSPSTCRTWSSRRCSRCSRPWRPSCVWSGVAAEAPARCSSSVRSSNAT